jgi:hypothetical protein
MVAGAIQTTKIPAGERFAEIKFGFFFYSWWYFF